MKKIALILALIIAIAPVSSALASRSAVYNRKMFIAASEFFDKFILYATLTESGNTITAENTDLTREGMHSHLRIYLDDTYSILLIIPLYDSQGNKNELLGITEVHFANRYNAARRNHEKESDTIFEIMRATNAIRTTGEDYIFNDLIDAMEASPSEGSTVFNGLVCEWWASDIGEFEFSIYAND